MGKDPRDMSDVELVSEFDFACRRVRESHDIIYGDKLTRPQIYARHDELRNAVLERMRFRTVTVNVGILALGSAI